MKILLREVSIHSIGITSGQLGRFSLSHLQSKAAFYMYFTFLRTYVTNCLTFKWPKYYLNYLRSKIAIPVQH
jgi:hypothetical protein